MVISRGLKSGTNEMYVLLVTLGDSGDKKSQQTLRFILWDFESLDQILSNPSIFGRWTDNLDTVLPLNCLIWNEILSCLQFFRKVPIGSISKMFMLCVYEDNNNNIGWNNINIGIGLNGLTLTIGLLTQCMEEWIVSLYVSVHSYMVRESIHRLLPGLFNTGAAVHASIRQLQVLTLCSTVNIDLTCLFITQLCIQMQKKKKSLHLLRIISCWLGLLQCSKTYSFCLNADKRFSSSMT